MTTPVKIYRINHPSSPWMVRYKLQGKLVRKYFTSEAEAKRNARETSRQLLEVGGAGVVMDAEARAEWYAARELLAPTGTSLLEAVRDYVARAKVLQNNFERPEFSETVKSFLTLRESRGRRERTISNLKSRMETLRLQGCGSWTTWNRPELEKAVFGSGLSPRSCINLLSVARNFSRWCVKRGWLPVDPTDGIERPEAPAPTPRILTPEELESLFAAGKEEAPVYQAWYGVLCLAGLRPSELNQMPTDLRPLVRDGQLLIHRVGKRHRETRMAPLCNRLKKILDDSSWSFKQPPQKRHKKIIGVAKIEWQEDICRHSFVSYRLALIKNRAQVCLEAGHSEATLKRYYAVAVSEKQAQEWFGNKVK